jgi:hypothetical protein
MMMCSLVVIIFLIIICVFAFGFIVHLPAYLRGAALIIAVQHRAVVVACLERVVEGTAGDQALLVQGVLVVLKGGQLAGKLGAHAAFGWSSLALLQMDVFCVL